MPENILVFLTRNQNNKIPGNANVHTIQIRISAVNEPKSDFRISTMNEMRIQMKPLDLA